MNKYNSIIKKIFLMAVLTIVVYNYTKDEEEWFKYGKEIFDIIYQLALGYVISYIFYLVTIYYPTKYKNKKIYISLCKEIYNTAKENEKILSTVFFGVNKDVPFENFDVHYRSIYYDTEKHMHMILLNEFDFERKQEEVVPNNLGNIREYSFYHQRFYEMYYESLQQLKNYFQCNMREMIEFSFNYQESKNIVDKSEELLEYICKFDINKHNILLEYIKDDKDAFREFVHSEDEKEYKLLNPNNYCNDKVQANNILRELYNLIHINVEYLHNLNHLIKSFQK